MFVKTVFASNLQIGARHVGVSSLRCNVVMLLPIGRLILYLWCLIFKEHDPNNKLNEFILNSLVCVCSYVEDHLFVYFWIIFCIIE